MKNIFIIGAGLSTPCLIKYLTERSEEYNWNVTVGDISKEMVEKRLQDCPKGKAVAFDVFNDKQRASYISKADLVISMLPARMHYLVAKTCIRYKKDMVTASYVSDEVREFHQQAKENGTILLNEIGLDPGIDHMSAMKVINELKGSGAKLSAFRSSTGGLVAPKYDNNPWNYKFTWNPRNVVVAGQGGAQFISHGAYKYIPYHKVFTRSQRMHINGYGEFENYPNRDSLKYRTIYGLEDIPTIYRGTIRRPGFSKTWQTLVEIGATDDSFIVENSENMTYRDFINTFLRYEEELTVEQKFAKYVGLEDDSIFMYRLRWLGLFEDKKIELKNATPAQIMQKLLETKWKLDEDDKDMIVMQHRFDYELNGEQKILESSMAVEGQDSICTAMAITVGYPVAIASKLILTGEITSTGVKLPTTKDIYEPILKELESFGIKFTEKEIEE